MNRHSAAGLAAGFICGVLLMLLLGWGSRYTVVVNELDHNAVKVDRLRGRTWILVNPKDTENCYWRELGP